MILFLCGSFYLSSCINFDPETGLYSHGKSTDTSKEIPEEEIQYFFPAGGYYIEKYDLYSATSDEEIVLSISSSKEFEELDWYMDWDRIKYKTIVDQKDNIIDKTGFLSTLEKVMIDGSVMFKIEGKEKKALVDSYDFMEEGYDNERESTFAFKLFCTKPQPEALPEDLIFDDNFVVKLYDKNNKVISEYKMRNRINYEDYKRDPKAAQNKLGYSSNASLIGMLKLPPKGQREGLKYRVVRLDANGNPRPYLKRGVEKPYQHYLWEEPLPLYSEYKNWDYSEESGCYHYIARFERSLKEDVIAMKKQRLENKN